MMKRLHLPPSLEGLVWLHTYRGPKQRYLEHHRELEFDFVIRGRATYLVDHRKYVLMPNSLIWLFPSQQHVLLNETPDCDMWIAVARPRLLRRTCTREPFKALTAREPAGAFCRRLTLDAARELDALLRSVSAGRDLPDFFNTGLAYVFHKAWMLSREEHAVTPVGDVHPCVQRAAQMIDRQDLAASTEEIAKSSGLSVSRLRRLFKEQVGIGIHEYRNRVMVERFITDYAGGRKKMLQAALDAGFGSYAQFYRVFTETTGSPPAKYYRRTAGVGP